MKKTYHKVKRGSQALFLCLTALLLPVTASLPVEARTKQPTQKREKVKKNTFATPDFAFPQTVSDNAEKEFDTAVSHGDGVKALQAAIQLSVASSLVSQDSVDQSLDRFRKIADTMRAPYDKLALILEANLYSEIYSDNSWHFNSRTIPATPRPANVQEWSKQMFSDQIQELLHRAFDNSESLALTQLSEIAPLVDADEKRGDLRGLSILDFMTFQAVEALEPFQTRSMDSIIPFGKSEDREESGDDVEISIGSLIDAAVARHADDADKQVYAAFCLLKAESLSGESRSEFLKECVEKLKDTPYCAQLLTEYCDSLNAKSASARNENQLRRIKYDLLKSYYDKNPDGWNIGYVQQALNSLTRVFASVEFPGQTLPGKDFDAIVTASNIYDLWLLVYRLPNTSRDKDWSYAQLSTHGTLKNSIPVKYAGSTPDSFTDTITVPALEPGRYALVLSRMAKGGADQFICGNIKEHVSKMRVSDISVFNIQGRNELPGMRVVSAINGKPLASAKVTLYELGYGNSNKTPIVKYADAKGAVEIGKGQYEYVVEYGKSRLTGNFYSYYYGESNSQDRIDADVLTSLSIYKPGDEVEFSAVVYIREASGKTLRPALNRDVDAILLDANYQNVDTLKLKTDEFGRVGGKFKLPDTGLLGNYSVRISANGRSCGETSFEVAEYKSPTFYAMSQLAEGDYKAGDTLKFTGKAMTYAGMPVIGGRVSYTVEYQPLWWWRNSASDARYGGETETGADGGYTIELPTERLKDTPYAFGRYVIKVAVTDAAGETQQAPALAFSIGNAYNLNPERQIVAEVAEQPLSMNVPVYNLAGKPVKKTVEYSVKKNGVTVVSGEFMSPSLALDVAKLPSGRYEIEYRLQGEPDTDTASTDLVIYRAGDSKPPIETPLWIPDKQIVAPEGAKSIQVRVGSSYTDSYIFAQTVDSKSIVSEKWIHVSDGIAEVPVDIKSDTERIYINFFGERNLKSETGTVEVIPFYQTRMLQAETVSFRDRLDPGAKEQWKFRFSYNGEKMPSIPVMAVMSNKALNALAPFSWHLNPYASLSWTPAGAVRYSDIYSRENSGYLGGGMKTKRTLAFEIPDWNTYGYPLYGGSNMYFLSEAMPMAAANSEIRIRGSRTEMKMSAASQTTDDLDGVSYKESAVEFEEPREESAAGSLDAGAQEKTQLREIECPLAFFMPDLVTDSHGETEVNFTVPQFVGTWQFQIAGYMPDMKGTVLTVDAVASKRVMAQLNAPRFARTGDELTVGGTLYNNSDASADVSGRIEILDGTTGKVLASADYAPKNVEPSGSYAVMTGMKLPDDISDIIVRIYARVPGFSDGEQTVVPVLPSSAPIVESTPFYFRPGPGSYEVKLPSYAKDATVTLKYCDNPVWECVTALPSIVTPNSVSILSQIHALYGNAVAKGLFEKYPQLIEGIKAMAAPENASDSSLVSPLLKNGELKTVALNNTPWVNNAKSESLRMQSLMEYADTEKATAAVKTIMKTISDRQNADGGWSWCPDMQSSVFITGRVLLWFSMLKSMDFLPEGGEEMALKALRYTDAELVKSWKRDKYFSPATLLNYLYVKSSFAKAGNADGFDKLEKEAMKEIRSGWRNFDIYDKGVASVLLYRKGEAKTAAELLESLRQFASENPEKGMWFDNLKGSFSGWNPLITTAQVLEAFAEIEPRNPAIDKLRQYLLVCKQVQDWGDDSNTCEVIHAILSTGSEWIADGESSEIRLGGKALHPSKSAALTGAFTLDIPVKDASKAKLEIRKKSAGPSWGGVISQYVAPILDVKAEKIPQLSIVKALYAVTPDSEGVKASRESFKVGDRIKVTLTITADRDMDYVAVTDQRGACLEPAEQVSEYTSSDGLWFYQEVRDQATNLFIPFLPKGTHVISYECFADREGVYSVGVATAQSQYEPLITAHSAGMEMTVK